MTMQHTVVLTEYGLKVNRTGRYAALYRPCHLIGLELGVSVASAVIRGESTGTPQDWKADVVAIAKRNLQVGEILDGEGSSTVWGKLLPARQSVHYGALPIGRSNGVKLQKSIHRGKVVHWYDVAVDADLEAVKIRRMMEETSLDDA